MLGPPVEAHQGSKERVGGDFVPVGHTQHQVESKDSLLTCTCCTPCSSRSPQPLSPWRAFVCIFFHGIIAIGSIQQCARKWRSHPGERQFQDRDAAMHFKFLWATGKQHSRKPPFQPKVIRINEWRHALLEW